ncbi:MAG: hypothetical protein R2879_01530 [Saprospiraceae bacterium]
MKKTIFERVRMVMVTGVCLIAFFFVGLQDSFGQTYVDNATATARLETELQSVGDVYYDFQGNPANYTHQYQGLQIYVYKNVHREIAAGADVADAIRNNWIGGSQGTSQQGLAFWERAAVPVQSLTDTDAQQIMTSLMGLLSL